ncbi:hypothetical protein FB451DRAFT_1182384 [Mycena latifolia]|nr:hypothetical protein FB451DRAFT_1182384 [Mycena latifolia]
MYTALPFGILGPVYLNPRTSPQSLRLSMQLAHPLVSSFLCAECLVRPSNDKCPIAKQAPISTRRGSMPYRRHDYKAFSADFFIQNTLQAQQNLHHAARSTDPQHQQRTWEAIDGILSIQGSSTEERRDWWRRSQCSITRALGLALPAAPQHLVIHPDPCPFLLAHGAAAAARAPRALPPPIRPTVPPHVPCAPPPLKRSVSDISRSTAGSPQKPPPKKPRRKRPGSPWGWSKRPRASDEFLLTRPSRLPFPLPPWGSLAHAALTPRTPRRCAHQTLSASSHRRRGSSSSRSRSRSRIPPPPGLRAELTEVETLLLFDGASDSNSDSDGGPFFSFPPTPAVRPPEPSPPVPPTLPLPMASPARVLRASAEHQSVGIPPLLKEESDEEEDGSPARNTLFLTAEEPELITAFAGLTLSGELQADGDTATDSSDEGEDAEAARARQAKRAGKQKAREPSDDEHAQLQKDERAKVCAWQVSEAASLALLQHEQEAADAETARLLQMAEHVRTAHPLPFAFGDVVPMDIDKPDSIALQLQQHFDAAALERGKRKEAGKDVEKGKGKEKQCQRPQSLAEAGPSIPPLTEEDLYAISVHVRNRMARCWREIEDEVTLEFEFARLQDVFRLGYPIILTHDIADFLEDHPLPHLEVREEVESRERADDPRLQRARTDAADAIEAAARHAWDAAELARDNDAIERDRAARENSEAGRALREAAAEQARVRAARVTREERCMELMEARDFRRQERALRQQVFDEHDRLIEQRARARAQRNYAKKARRKARRAQEEEQRLRDQRGQEGDDKIDKAKTNEQEEPERDEAGKEEPKENEERSECKEEGMDAAGQEELRETEGRNSCEEEGMDGAGGYSEGESDLTPLSSSDCVPVPHAVSPRRLRQRIPVSYRVLADESDSEGAQTDPSPSAPNSHSAPTPDPGSSTSPASDSSSSEPKKKPKKKKKSKRKRGCPGCRGAEQRPLYRFSTRKWCNTCHYAANGEWRKMKRPRRDEDPVYYDAFFRTHVHEWLEWRCTEMASPYTPLPAPGTDHKRDVRAVFEGRPAATFKCCCNNPHDCKSRAGGSPFVPDGRKGAKRRRWCLKHRLRWERLWEKARKNGPIGETPAQLATRRICHIDEFIEKPLGKTSGAHLIPAMLTTARTTAHTHGAVLATRAFDGSAYGIRIASVYEILTIPRANVSGLGETAILAIIASHLNLHWVRCLCCGRFFTPTPGVHFRLGTAFDHRHGPGACIQGLRCLRDSCNNIGKIIDWLKQKHGELGPAARAELLALLLHEVNDGFPEWQALLDEFLASNNDLPDFPALWSSHVHPRWIAFCLRKLGPAARRGWDLHHCHVTGALLGWVSRQRNMDLGCMEREGRVRAWDACEGAEPDSFRALFETAYRAAIVELVDAAFKANEPDDEFSTLFDAVKADHTCSALLKRIERSVRRTADAEALDILVPLLEETMRTTPKIVEAIRAYVRALGVHEFLESQIHRLCVNGDAGTRSSGMYIQFPVSTDGCRYGNAVPVHEEDDVKGEGEGEVEVEIAVVSESQSDYAGDVEWEDDDNKVGSEGESEVHDSGEESGY